MSNDKFPFCGNRVAILARAPSHEREEPSTTLGGRCSDADGKVPRETNDLHRVVPSWRDGQHNRNEVPCGSQR